MDSSLHKTEQSLRRLAPFVSLALIAVLGWSLAQLFWLLWPAPENLPTVPPPKTASAAAKSNSPNINTLIAAHLFGKQEAKPVEQARPQEAPETRLNLTLKGIFAYDNDERSRAIIADNSRVERPYSVGDEIPGGATLDSIELDRVILKRGGRFETLKLERNSKKASNTRTASSSRSSRNIRATGIRNNSRSNENVTSATGAAAASLAAIRSEVLNDPSKIDQYVRIQPVQVQGGDGVRGYRIYPGNNRTAFRNAGLRAGEVVTSVNGVQLNDPAVALQLLGDVSSASEVTLTLERGGQSRTVTLDLSE